MNGSRTNSRTQFSRSRNWCFTLNNYSGRELQDLRNALDEGRRAENFVVMESSVLKSRIPGLLISNVMYILRDREASHRLRGYLGAHGYMLKLVRALQATIIITVPRAANLRNLETFLNKDVDPIWRPLRI